MDQDTLAKLMRMGSQVQKVLSFGGKLTAATGKSLKAKTKH
jgi:hypothetical protein